MIVRSRSPTRITFGGDGTDIEPYCDEREGSVLSAAINKYAYATAKTRDDQKICIESGDFPKKEIFESMREITYGSDLDIVKSVVKYMKAQNGLDIFIRNDVPPKSGLGSTASVFASVIGALNRIKSERGFTDYEIAEMAHQLAKDELKIGRGHQDHYATVFGGINYLEFKNGSARVNTLKMRKDDILEFEKNSLLVYTVDKLSSIDIIEDQMKRYRSGDQAVIDAFDESKQIAKDMFYALMKGDIFRFGELLDRSWEQKKKLSPMISTPYINDIYNLAKKNGAIGGKLCGSGGGGFMFFYCNPHKEHIVAEKLEKAGAKPVKFGLDFDGLQTWEVAQK